MPTPPLHLLPIWEKESWRHASLDKDEGTGDVLSEAWQDCHLIVFVGPDSLPGHVKGPCLLPTLLVLRVYQSMSFGLQERY